MSKFVVNVETGESVMTPTTPEEDAQIAADAAEWLAGAANRAAMALLATQRAAAINALFEAEVDDPRHNGNPKVVAYRNNKRRP